MEEYAASLAPGTSFAKDSRVLRLEMQQHQELLAFDFGHVSAVPDETVRGGLAVRRFLERHDSAAVVGTEDRVYDAPQARVVFIADANEDAPGLVQEPTAQDEVSLACRVGRVQVDHLDLARHEVTPHAGIHDDARISDDEPVGPLHAVLGGLHHEDLDRSSCQLDLKGRDDGLRGGAFGDIEHIQPVLYDRPQHDVHRPRGSPRTGQRPPSSPLGGRPGRWLQRSGDAGLGGGYLSRRGLSGRCPGAASTAVVVRTPSRISTRNPVPVVGSTPWASKRPTFEKAAARSCRALASNCTPSMLTRT